MTRSRIERLAFAPDTIRSWSRLDSRHTNWPVVYAIDGADEIYVGETANALGRMEQHLKTTKARLERVRVVIDETFNKSACLDLESHLIRWLSGDGAYRVLNRNEGMTNAEYFERDRYLATFREVFEALRAEGVFTRSIPEIENDDLFKLSPFKALTNDQAIAVEVIVDGLLDDLATGASSLGVIQGEPGTGKTIVAIYLMKLLSDIRDSSPEESVDADSMFSEYFVEDNRERLQSLRVGLVVPQQSLRKSIQRVFRKTPGLDPSTVLSAFDVGKRAERFDLLIVDEAHRLGQRANQSSGSKNREFQEINEALFGADDSAYTQLDWILKRSDHTLLLLDAEQSVRPADLPAEALRTITATARSQHRFHPLMSQMRVRAGSDYVGYVRSVLADAAVVARAFSEYDLRFYDDLPEMVNAIRARDTEHGLARLVAGYAWEWRSKGLGNRDRYDIEHDGVRLRWNGTDKDWINSSGSGDEVGSIHTVQGYDLNYAGVIIGADLRFDLESGTIVFDRRNYFDKKGKENNPRLGIRYSDEDLLRYVRNIYAVLLTRGIRGTYVYVVDPALREHLRPLLSNR